MQSWGRSIDSFEMNFGYFVQHTSPMKKHYFYFLIQPSGPASGSRRCYNMESWGPSNNSLEALAMNFGYFSMLSLWKDIIGFFLYHPSCWRKCWKMESWGPSIHSFKAFNMNFEYFVQYTSLLKRHYWLILISPSGPASGLRRCCNMESWGQSNGQSDGIKRVPIQQFWMPGRRPGVIL